MWKGDGTAVTEVGVDEEEDSDEANCCDDGKLSELKLLILLLLDSLNKTTLHELIGNCSKKTYANGSFIDVSLLFVQQFYDEMYKQYNEILQETNKIKKNDYICL